MIYPYTGDLWLIYYTVLFQLNLILDWQFTMHVLLVSTTTSTTSFAPTSNYSMTWSKGFLLLNSSESKGRMIEISRCLHRFCHKNQNQISFRIQQSVCPRPVLKIVRSPTISAMIFHRSALSPSAVNDQSSLVYSKLSSGGAFGISRPTARTFATYSFLPTAS